MKHNVNFTAIKYVILGLGLILGILALLGLIYYSYKLIHNSIKFVDIVKSRYSKI